MEFHLIAAVAVAGSPTLNPPAAAAGPPRDQHWSTMSSRLLLRSLLTLAIVVNAQLCYRPDGSSADERYAPCMAGQYSMCCRINDTVSPDTCRPDGLCQSSINPAYVWRESCTDREWKAPECLRLCIGECGGVFITSLVMS